MPFALPQAANLVILPPVHGVGVERFGTFTPAGYVYVEASCKGKGLLTIVRISRSGPCDGNPVQIGVPGNEGKPLPLVVRAQPGTTWRIAVGEHIAGATLVLVHKSGTGNTTFGPFQRVGTVTVAITCKGRGSLDVGVATTSPPHSDGLGAACPLPGRGSIFGPMRPPNSRFRIEVHGGPHLTWTVTVHEQDAK